MTPCDFCGGIGRLYTQHGEHWQLTNCPKCWRRRILNHITTNAATHPATYLNIPEWTRRE